MMGRAVGCLALLLAVLAGNLFAEELAEELASDSRIYQDGRAWVEEIQGSITIPGGQALLLRSDLGSVVLRSGPAGEVRYLIRKVAYRRTEEQARELFREFGVSVRHTQTEVRIVGEYERGGWPDRGHKFSVQYEITLPENFRADVETRGGEIEVEGLVRALRAVSAGGNISAGDIGGETEVETAGGSIALGSIGGPVRAQTAGGDIRVETVRGPATLETSGGSIRSGRVEGAVRANTAGGDIEIESAAGDVFARTAGGCIVVGEAGGRVQAGTAGGSIRVEGAVGTVEAHTAGGEIELEKIRGAVRAQTAAGNILARLLGEGKLTGESLLKTSFGDVVVYLAPELAVTIEAAIEMATGHRIETDFPLKIEGESERYTFGPGRVSAAGDVNGGGQRLRIYTVGGDIAIRKLSEELDLRQEKVRKHQHRVSRRQLAQPPKPPKPPKPPEEF